MRLNQECIRDLLLALENELTINSDIDGNELHKIKALSKYSSEDLAYTIQKLSEADYINSYSQHLDDVLGILVVTSITWDGHRFLDTIRDSKVWSSTKTIASKFSSISVSMIENVASTVLTNLINQQMNQF